jgi:type VII secretion-associated serine protease mycosin
MRIVAGGVRMVLRVVAAAAAAVALLAPPAPAAALVHQCQTPPAEAQVGKAEPAEVRLYDPGRLAPLATGAGVRVAVIDSGVDATHPQLRGHVAPGRDMLHGDPTGRQDCVGHGTAVASIIAAQPVPGVGFRGLAPGVTIVPVRVSEQEEIDGRAQGDPGTPGTFADAIAWAADPNGGRAQVINLSLVMTVDDARVRRAVADAIAAGVVVVAAAGNHAQEGDPTPYPAAYPDVVGVGAVSADGQRAGFSQRGGYVDIMAVGEQVTVAARRSGHTAGQGTSYAAPFVAATAALIGQRFPGATPAQVARRLVATADPAPGGARSDEYGYGLLNPYRALTETLGPDSPPPAPAVVHTEDPAAVALQARRAHARDTALVAAAVGAALVAVVALLAAVVRRGRRRGWRPPAVPDPVIRRT